MKAVLEFNYPDDENKLRRALHADQAFEALRELDYAIKYRWRKDDNLLDVLELVRDRLDTVLTTTGEGLRKGAIHHEVHS